MSRGKMHQTLLYGRQCSGNQKTDTNPDSKYQAWDISAGKKAFIEYWTLDDVWHKLEEILLAFSSCAETLPEIYIKCGRLIYLVQEIQRQLHIEAVAELQLGGF